MSDLLEEFLGSHQRLFVLTGAGISTGSGIPDYRDDCGNWKLRNPPIKHAEFVNHLPARQRYWARSAVGWPVFRKAVPNAAHHALAALEQSGKLELLVTQNVDSLHQRAGSRRVVDLHGALRRTVCLGCGASGTREDFQGLLIKKNPRLQRLVARVGPDGDANLDKIDFTRIDVPACTACGGLVKPDVVFFGANVPRARVDTCLAALQQADAVLVIGSSLQIFSGLRFVRAARKIGLPVAAVNIGRTRADDLLQFRVAQDCVDALVNVTISCE